MRLTFNAINYTVQELLKFAGLNNSLKDIRINDNNGSRSIEISIYDQKVIELKLMSETESEELIKGTLPLVWILSFDGKINVPVFFVGPDLSFASFSDQQLIINADIVTLSFILLSRFEETVVQKRDQYGRFEYLNSLAYKFDFIDIPIVDEYAMLLKLWLLRFIPNLKINKGKGKVIPTHDIDGIRRFGNLFRNLKTIIGGDIIIRKSLSVALKSLKQCASAIQNTKNDPLIIAIERLIEISKNSGLCSEFYFMGLHKGQYDSRYDIISPEVKYCMDKIRNAGMIVGMHGGFDSFNSEHIYKQEKENIELIYEEPVTLGRQHFLRFDINETIDVWQKVKIEIDSSLGYAEREGFRCGTCHEYNLYDLKNDKSSSVKERPIIVMDKTLFEDRKQNNEMAYHTLNMLHSRCKAVDGNLVILWHNETVFRDYENKFIRVYCKFMESLIGEKNL